MASEERILPKTIEMLADAVYPSFEMLAGMEVEYFYADEGWAANS